MACRWRIRHKLMLGLGVVIAIIGLLLGGTFLGLRSYRVTTRNFESKIVELRKANNLRDIIKVLDNSALIENTAEADRKLQATLPEVSTALEDYELQLQETLSRGRALDDGFVEREQVRVLRQHLQKLRETIEEHINNNAPLVNQGTRPTLAKMPEITKLLKTLVRDADDLNHILYDGLEKRIKQSREDCDFSLYAVLFISISGVLLLIGLLWRFYCWIFYPIRNLQQGAERIAQGDFDHRIEVNSSDELQKFAEAFNHMTDRLRDIYADLARQVNERSRQLVRSERLASVGFLAAGVAHEINNPLASIAFCSEALEHRLMEMLDKMQNRLKIAGPVVSDQDRETMARYLKMIQNEAFRCKEITQRLLEFSRGGEKRREPVDLNEITQSVIEMVQHLQNCKGKHIVFDPAGTLIAWVNAQEIKSVVLNLVVNALESMEEGGTLTITQEHYDGMAELIFEDTGCGMSAEVLDNIFEPFFTRSRTGKGTGLGLSISHRVISQHDGEIEASSPGPNRGSVFVVRLPLKPREETGRKPETHEHGDVREEISYPRRFAA